MIDLPGAGNSRFRGNLTMETWLDDIRDVYRALCLGRSIWIGASIGGWLMLHIQRRNPGWFHSMCALAPAIDWDENLVLPGMRSGTFIASEGVVSVGGAQVPLSLLESMPAFRVLHAPFEIHVPLHVIQGEDDETALPAVTRQLVDQLGQHCTIDLLPADGHGVAKLGTQAALDRFARWLRREMDLHAS